MMDFNYPEFSPLAHPSISILPEPSFESADPLPCTYPIHCPTSAVVPGFAIPSASKSICLDLCCFNQNAVHQSLVDNGCADTSPVAGYLSPSHDIASTNSPASTPSVQKASRVKSTSHGHAKGKTASGRNQRQQKKQE
ncbi:uncharacterized protein N7479_006545 [Penicillium vulpinum]|nr:uncharacterized protein N7479_006545 [Penicillium vulpinum]KAJ5959395.1 hypothetical protein N7479_006545 [Penicillium vulpinum]